MFLLRLVSKKIQFLSIEKKWSDSSGATLASALDSPQKAQAEESKQDTYFPKAETTC